MCPPIAPIVGKLTSQTVYERARPLLQHSIKAAYYRGGTSRAVIIEPRHLPPERAKWPMIFRQIMGSGDPYGRQLDGMGAGISSLSKICLVEPYQPNPLGDGPQDVHIDYTFVGLGIENDEVDVAGNCGNMSSAIGPFAFQQRLLPKIHDSKWTSQDITVKIRNTNTGKIIHSTFPVIDLQPVPVGDYAIDGVAGTGAKIKLDFMDPYGSKTGKLLPTGNIVDTVQGFEVTCVDGANPAVFIRAADMGIDGAILPDAFNTRQDVLEVLESIRKSAAVAMGIAATPEEIPRTIPKIGLVSKSSTHPVLSGQVLQKSHMDIVVRFLSDTQPHRAIPLTAALTTAVAARIPGSIVHQLLAPSPVMKDAITIGHASGRLQVNATMDEKDAWKAVSATVYRTAKRIFSGDMYYTDSGEVDPRGLSYGTGGEHSLGMAFVNESRGQPK